MHMKVGSHMLVLPAFCAPVNGANKKNKDEF